MSHTIFPTNITVHFDINGTIKFGDIASNRTPDETIHFWLARATQAVWEENLPSMSYWQYVREHVYPGPPDESSSNRDFLFHRFVIWLNEPVHGPEKNPHPLAERLQIQYQDLSHALKKGDFFTSFMTVFQKLKEDNDRGGSHTILFRTFGKELHSVETLIQKSYPDIQFSKAAYIIQGRGTAGERLALQVYRPNTKAPYITTNFKSMQEVFNRSRYWLVQDCHKFWQKTGHNEQGKYGKPFPYALEPNRVYYFLDDHAEAKKRDERTIVNPIDTTEKMSRAIDIPDTQGRVIHVDSVKAALDETYFLRTLEFAS